jgi:predicted kinase
MKNLFKGLLLSLTVLATTACTDYRTIPVSTVGKVVDNTGVSKETYPAGTRDIGWAWKYNKKLVLLDQSVEIIPFNLSIRLADNQTLDVELLIKTQLDLNNQETIDSMFTMITPIDQGGNTLKIPLTLIYQKLGEDLVRRTLVEVVTPHTLESFQKDRKLINDTIEKIISQRFENTPLVLYTATINKVQYPQTYIAKANEIKDMEMSVELKTAEELAKRERLRQEEITISIDQRVRLAKAETIRLENKKTSEGLNPMLLEYRKMELEELRLQVDMEFAKNSGKSGNTVYYPVGQKPNYIETRLGQIK